MIDSDPTPPTDRHVAAPGDLRRALGGPPGELLFGGAVAVASMILVGWLGRNLWFRFDNFEILTNRRFGSLDDWFRPHYDHWLTWTVLVSRGLYRVADMDFWPWWYLPRLIGAAVVAFLFWRTFLHRGAHRLIAFGTYLTLLVLAVSYFQDALTVANYVLFPSVVVVALLVDEVEEPRRRDLVIVGACLVAALMANGYGVALLLAVTTVVVVRRRFRQWAPSLFPPAVMLVGWYLWYRSQLPRQGKGLSPSFAFEATGSAFVVLRVAVQNTFGLPRSLAVIGVAAIAGQLLWLLRKRRLDMFDAIVVLTLALVLAVLAWARTTEGAQAASPRYGYAVVLLLTLVLAPRLRVPTGRGARTSVALVLVAVVTFNAVSLSRRLHDTGVVSQEIRATAQTTAALIAAGEPYSYWSNLGRGIAPRQVQRLVNEGWNPPRSADPAFVTVVRGRMRIALLGPVGGLADVAGLAAPAAVGVDDHGCLRVSAPSVVDLHVKRESAFTVDRMIEIIWTDRFGTVRRSGGPAVVSLAPPDGETTVMVRTFGQKPTKICALAPVGPPTP